MAQILEGNIHRFLDKLEGSDEAEIVPPDTRVLVPILEKMRFIDDEKVVDYYAEILATASLKETAGRPNIVFIEILNRLSADELIILEYVKEPVRYKSRKVKNNNNTELLNKIEEIDMHDDFPVIDVQVWIHNRQRPFYDTEFRNVNFLSEILKIKHRENIGIYIDNMISLGLLEKKTDVFLEEEIYKYIEYSELVNIIRKKLSKDETVECKRGIIKITDMGIKLVSFGLKS